MARFSTGLRNAIVTNSGLGVLMNGGMIKVYGGSRPESPDNAPGSSVLGEITNEGLTFVPNDPTGTTGLALQFASPGMLINDGVWRLVGKSAGFATWWRWCWAFTDPLTYSTYYPRIDGNIGTELILRNKTISLTTNTRIESFLLLLDLGE